MTNTTKVFNYCIQYTYSEKYIFLKVFKYFWILIKHYENYDYLKQLFYYQNYVAHMTENKKILHHIFLKKIVYPNINFCIDYTLKSKRTKSYQYLISYRK